MDTVGSTGDRGRVAHSLPDGGCVRPGRILLSSSIDLPRKNKQTKKPQPLSARKDENDS